MSLRLTILGCHSATPRVNAHPTSQYLEINNRYFLIDCGEGTQRQMRKYKVGFSKINHIFISHLHGDHFFGLVGLLSTMHLLGRKNELTIFGPKGLEEIVQIQFRNAGSHLSFEMNFQTVDQSGEILLENSKLTVKSLPLKHRIPCYGYLFEEKEGLRKIKVASLAKYRIPTYARKSITEGEDFKTSEGEVIPNRFLTDDPPKPTKYAFCSDTAYYEKLIPLLKEVDLLYHEATFLADREDLAKKTKHSTSKQAAQIAKDANINQLVLGHYSGRYKDTSLFKQEAEEIFKNTDLAEPGKVFSID